MSTASANWQPSPKEARREIERRVEAHENLLRFTEYTLPGFQSGGHHKEICEALEAVERGDLKRLMITAPPRHTKSELASRRFPAWYLGRNPDRQVIATSYSADLATDFGRDVRNIVSDPLYQNVFQMQLRADSAAANRWATNRGGRYVATGVGGPITGRGAHLGIIDDPFKNRQDADSETLRESIWNWYTSTFYTRLMPGGAVVIVCTRWHEDDLAGRALNQNHEDWHLIEFPAINNQGEALWPEWYPVEELHRIQQTIGPRDWTALYQQQPQAEEGDYFRREWFKRYDQLPQKVTKYLCSDHAVTDGGGDYTEHGVWGIDSDDDLWAVDWWHGQTTADEWIDAQCDLIAKHKPLMAIGETGVIRRAVEPFLIKRMRERRTYCRLEWLVRGRDKAAMARSFQARAAMGKVHIPNTEWGDRLVDQLVKFPAGVNDDAVDVCALIGMALDDTHGAPLAKAPGSGRERDPWTGRSMAAGDDDWRTM